MAEKFTQDPAAHSNSWGSSDIGFDLEISLLSQWRTSHRASVSPGPGTWSRPAPYAPERAPEEPPADTGWEALHPPAGGGTLFAPS